MIFTSRVDVFGISDFTNHSLKPETGMIYPSQQIGIGRSLTMKAIKKILFGISLILFGFFCLYVSIAANWDMVQYLGLLIPVIGLGFAINGFIEKGE